MEIHMPHRRENGKYLCSGCGRQVDFSELRCCETCGYFFCPSCQERHRCRVTEEGVVEIHVFDPYSQKKQMEIDDLFEDTPKIEDIVFFDSKNPSNNSEAKHTAERVFCSKCGDVVIKDLAVFCSQCGKYFCKNCAETHRCNPTDIANYQEKLEQIRIQKKAETERAKQVEQERKNQERAGDPDKFTRCDNCGNYFFNQEMKRCSSCGAILCPTCRESHTHSILENIWREKGKLKKSFSRNKN